MENNNADAQKKSNSTDAGNKKPSDKQATGRRGEDCAYMYLIRCGYRVICRNFACKTGEIDIIAINSENSAVISFVEVKCRHSLRYGLPCQAVGSKKQMHIRRSAEYFLFKNRQYAAYQPSFDVIEIIDMRGRLYLRHIKNAF